MIKLSGARGARHIDAGCDAMWMSSLAAKTLIPIQPHWIVLVVSARSQFRSDCRTQ
jgi:hypothetical protein